MTKNLLAKQIVGIVQANVDRTEECIAIVEDMLEHSHNHKWTFVRSYKDRNEPVDEYACSCGAHLRSKVFYIESIEVT